MSWELSAIFNFLKISMRADIFRTEKCKVTFGLKYTKTKAQISCVVAAQLISAFVFST